MKNYMNKIFAASLLVIFSTAFIGCTQFNPIEGYNDKEVNVMGNDDSNLEVVEKGLAHVDYYTCLKEYSKERCVNFKKLFGSYDSPEISNPYYDDKGNYTYKSSSSSAKVESSSSEQITYLQKNTSIYITMISFEQLVEKISDDDPIIDPELRFIVNSYSDGVLASTKYSKYLLTGVYDVKKWDEPFSDYVDITRGIDEIHICVEVTDKGKENTTYVTKDDKCVVSKKIGLLKSKDVQKESDSSNKLFKVDYEWYII